MAASAQEYDVYILAGQSNMDGRGANSDLKPPLDGPQKNVRFYYQNGANATNGWIDLAPGYSIPPGYKDGLPSKKFGPEIPVGAALAKALPDRKIAILKISRGGTSLAKDWKIGTSDDPKSQGPLYKEFHEGVPKALKMLKDAGDTCTLKAMIWHQGESDSASTDEVYAKMLTDFIARVREDLGQPNLPFVIGEVYDNGKRNSILAAQKAVSKAVPHTALASAADTKTWDNGTHFDAASVFILGERMAAEALKLVGKK
jgi:iduronate 2-sulfatase